MIQVTGTPFLPVVSSVVTVTVNRGTSSRLCSGRDEKTCRTSVERYVEQSPVSVSGRLDTEGPRTEGHLEVTTMSVTLRVRQPFRLRESQSPR